MGLSAKLRITVKNPAYPNTPGEYSTLHVEETLGYDPLFKHLSNVPVKFNVPGEGLQTLVLEVRDKKWEVDTTTGNTVAVYSLSPFGVRQLDGSSYGND